MASRSNTKSSKASSSGPKRGRAKKSAKTARQPSSKGTKRVTAKRGKGLIARAAEAASAVLAAAASGAVKGAAITGTEVLANAVTVNKSDKKMSEPIMRNSSGSTKRRVGNISSKKSK